jgi:CBS domain-containing protein
MITDRDITIRATAAGQEPTRTRVREVMSPTVVYCFEDQDVQQVADMMRENQIRRLVVLDRDKRMVGIVSLGDVAVAAGDDRLSGRTLHEVSQPAAPDR